MHPCMPAAATARCAVFRRVEHAGILHPAQGPSCAFRDLLCLRTQFFAHTKRRGPKSGSSGTAASLARTVRTLSPSLKTCTSTYVEISPPRLEGYSASIPSFSARNNAVDHGLHFHLPRRRPPFAVAVVRPPARLQRRLRLIPCDGALRLAPLAPPRTLPTLSRSINFCRGA